MTTKEMTQTTLKVAAKYGVYENDLIEFGQEYGYKFHKIQHNKGFNKTWGRANDIVLMKSDPTSEEFDPMLSDPNENVGVEVLVGNCHQCGEDCAMYGWSEGGAHISTCSCECVDCG